MAKATTSDDQVILMKKIVIATDVRFWRRRTGAQQRIFSLASYLAKQFDITTVFTAPLSDADDEDLALAEKSRMKVVSVFDDWKPASLPEKARLQFDSIVNLFSRSNETHELRPRKLRDFESGAIRFRFNAMLKQIRPDWALLEYATMAWLIPDRSQRQAPELANTRFAIDTHDLLSVRCEQFRTFGHQHWLDISQEEEAAALRRADLLIAIQDGEARTIRDWVGPTPQVIVARHAVDIAQADEPVVGPPKVGVIASDNAANRDGIDWFLDQVWPQCIRNSPNLRLVVAGSLGRYVQTMNRSGVDVVDQINDLIDFYSSVHVVVNPVRFGTGLKIKTLEALGFSKPLVSTPHGVEGLMGAIGSHQKPGDGPLVVAESPAVFASMLNHLANSPADRGRLAAAAGEWSARSLAPDIVYRSLIESLT